jgi:hypothetical protein
MAGRRGRLVLGMGLLGSHSTSLVALKRIQHLSIIVCHNYYVEQSV